MLIVLFSTNQTTDQCFKNVGLQMEHIGARADVDWGAHFRGVVDNRPDRGISEDRQQVAQLLHLRSAGFSC